MYSRELKKRILAVCREVDRQQARINAGIEIGRGTGFKSQYADA